MASAWTSVASGDTASPWLQQNYPQDNPVSTHQSRPYPPLPPPPFCLFEFHFFSLLIKRASYRPNVLRCITFAFGGFSSARAAVSTLRLYIISASPGSPRDLGLPSAALSEYHYQQPTCASIRQAREKLRRCNQAYMPSNILSGHRALFACAREPC